MNGIYYIYSLILTVIFVEYVQLEPTSTVSSVEYINSSNASVREIELFSDEKAKFFVNLFLSSNESLQVNFSSSDLRVAYIEQNTTVMRNDWVQKNAANFSLQVEIIVVGVRLGKTIINVNTRTNATSQWQAPSSGNPLVIIFLRRTDFKDTIFLVFTILFVIIVTTIIGATLEIDTIGKILKKPIAPFIGFFGQFVIMPNLALAIAKIANLSPEFGLGILTMGCAPGGGNSNSWTLLLKGDLNLSMTMTFLSTILSLGMMPLWLFAYARFFVDPAAVKIPFDQIATNCLGVVIPCIVGMLIKWKFPKVAAVMEKFLKPLIIFFIVFILTFGTWVNLYLYQLMAEFPIVILVSTCLPWFGYVFGYLIAFLCRQSYKQCVTIALETGIQNVGIPIVVLLYSMPKPEGDFGAIVPVIVSLTGPIPLYIWLLIRTVMNKRKKKKYDEPIEIVN